MMKEKNSISKSADNSFSSSGSSESADSVRSLENNKTQVTDQLDDFAKVLKLNMSHHQKRKFRQLIEPLNISKLQEKQEKIKSEVHKSDQKLGDISLKKWIETSNKEVEHEITNKMQKKFLILEDFNERALKFIEALFHTWSI